MTLSMEKENGLWLPTVDISLTYNVGENIDLIAFFPEVDDNFGHLNTMSGFATTTLGFIPDYSIHKGIRLTSYGNELHDSNSDFPCFYIGCTWNFDFTESKLVPPVVPFVGRLDIPLNQTFDDGRLVYYVDGNFTEESDGTEVAGLVSKDQPFVFPLSCFISLFGTAATSKQLFRDNEPRQVIFLHYDSESGTGGGVANIRYDAIENRHVLDISTDKALFKPPIVFAQVTGGDLGTVMVQETTVDSIYLKIYKTDGTIDTNDNPQTFTLFGVGSYV